MSGLGLRLGLLAKEQPKVIEQLKKILLGKTKIYLDFANILGLQDRLKWQIDLKRLKQFFDSFDNITSVNLYFGDLENNSFSKEIARNAIKFRYNFTTKQVKIFRLSIDVSDIHPNSSIRLESFIRKSLLDKFNLETIRYLNSKLKELNEIGIKFIEDRKCNFDVEIGRDMLLDYKNNTENFILWSGDSDFADPLTQLLNDRKNVAIFATARVISHELSELTKKRTLHL